MAEVGREEYYLATPLSLIYGVEVALKAGPVRAGPLPFGYFYDLSYRPVNHALDRHAGLHWQQQPRPLRPHAAVRQPWPCCVPGLLGNFSAKCFPLEHVK